MLLIKLLCLIIWQIYVRLGICLVIPGRLIINPAQFTNESERGQLFNYQPLVFVCVNIFFGVLVL